MFCVLTLVLSFMFHVLGVASFEVLRSEALHLYFVLPLHVLQEERAVDAAHHGPALSVWWQCK